MYNTLYYSSFKIGSAQQTFTAVQDTGSSNIWVPGVQCRSTACEGKNLFNPASSSSYRSNNESISIEYGSGDMKGVVGYDTINLGGYNVIGQGFGVASSLSMDFDKTPFDGLFGLAYKSLSEDSVPTWFDNAVYQKLFDRAILSFYLSNTPSSGDSRLIIGEPDPQYYQGSITWHQLVPLDPKEPAGLYYNIAFNGISVGDQSISLDCQYSDNGCRTIIDSGTSFILGPENAINQILSLINIQSDCANLSEQPVLNFSIDGQIYKVQPEFYVVKVPDDSGNLQCTVAIDSTGDSSWIFGDAFMRTSYSIFDKTGDRVGFAELADAYKQPKSIREY